MTKILVALPCTAQELENALHAVCDRGGLWDAWIDSNVIKETQLVIKTEAKGEAK